MVNEFQNLTLICNVRSDTVMFDLPSERTGKRGRPRKHGERLSFTDFPFKEVPDTDFYAGSRTVLTNLFGNRTVYATVTKSKKSGSFRLFLCTKSPDQLGFDPHFASTAVARAYAETDPAFLPLTVYALRWQIEVAYYEQKNFWSLVDYMLRSKVGIERLLNLLTLIYSSMILLPYLDGAFSALKQCSPQQARFVLGNLIQRQVFFATFAAALESDKNTIELAHCLRNYISELGASA